MGTFDKVANSINPADIKSKVRSIIEQRNTQSREKFEEQAYEIILPGAKLFQDQSLKLVFLSALDEQYTIHGYEAFVTDCLPVLVNTLQQCKPKHRQRNNNDHTRKKGVLKSPSKPIRKIGTRRSPRNQKPDIVTEPKFKPKRV